MLDIRVSPSKLQVLVRGHLDEKPACGAITMLMRAANMVALKLYGEPGLSVLQFKEDYDADFEALVFGLECIASKIDVEIMRVSEVYGPLQIV